MLEHMTTVAYFLTWIRHTGKSYMVFIRAHGEEKDKSNGQMQVTHTHPLPTAEPSTHCLTITVCKTGLLQVPEIQRFSSSRSIIQRYITFNTSYSFTITQQSSRQCSHSTPVAQSKRHMPPHFKGKWTFLCHQILSLNSTENCLLGLGWQTPGSNHKDFQGTFPPMRTFKFSSNMRH